MRARAERNRPEDTRYNGQGMTVFDRKVELYYDSTLPLIESLQSSGKVISVDTNVENNRKFDEMLAGYWKDIRGEESKVNLDTRGSRSTSSSTGYATSSSSSSISSSGIGSIGRSTINPTSSTASTTLIGTMAGLGTALSSLTKQSQSTASVDSAGERRRVEDSTVGKENITSTQSSQSTQNSENTQSNDSANNDDKKGNNQLMSYVVGGALVILAEILKTDEQKLKEKVEKEKKDGKVVEIIYKDGNVDTVKYKSGKIVHYKDAKEVKDKTVDGKKAQDNHTTSTAADKKAPTDPHKDKPTPKDQIAPKATPTPKDKSPQKAAHQEGGVEITSKVKDPPSIWDKIFPPKSEGKDKGK